MLEVQRVARASDHPALAGWHFERPVVGHEATNVLHVDGWVLGDREPVSCVELLRRGTVITRAADYPSPHLEADFPAHPHAASAGFRLSLSSLDLPVEWEVEVRATVGAEHVMLARLSGRRAPLATGLDPSIHPLVLTTLGRTGSIWVTYVLHHHPAVVAYRPFEFEAHVAAYWVEVLRTLASPTSSLTAIDPGPFRARPTWWLGKDWPHIAAMPHGNLEELFDREQIEALARFCHERIDAFAHALADFQGRPGAQYFVEKAPPDFVTRDLMLELYPGARDVVLVRDFRDLFCSMRAYAQRRGFFSQGREVVDSDEAYVSFLGEFARSLVEVSHRGAHVVRYEDAVREPEATFRGILEFAQLEASDATVHRMLSDAVDERPGMATHRTSESAEASIGRHRRELEPELRDLIEREVGPAMIELGYDLER
jgi:hypothetical protein